ncbi:hypothetical protein [Almyronema epifaneia]|uniref:Uncharacterized protein n=1 Tax=Almyronema epifaneia S1 TaxID=2991925 RepID=A0ABW6ICA3_9CYAN
MTQITTAGSFEELEQLSNFTSLFFKTLYERIRLKAIALLALGLAVETRLCLRVCDRC